MNQNSRSTWINKRGLARGCGRVSLAAAIGALCILLWPACCSAVSFQATGELTYRGTRTNNFEKCFCIHVSDCKWSISTWKAGPAPTTITSFTFDGTNIYKITEFGVGLPQGLGKVEGGRLKIYPLDQEKLVKTRNRGSVIVTVGQIPEYDASLVAPLWLMFASGCVFQESGNQGEVKPMWAGGPSGTREIAYAEWDLNAESPHFPKEVRFRAKVGGSPKVVFETGGLQSQENLTYPTYGLLTQFATSSGADESQRRILTTLEIRVTKFDAEAQFAPAMVPTNSIVTDERLRLSSSNAPAVYFPYFSSNGVIADPDQVKKASQFQIEAGRYRAKNQRNITSRFCVVAFLGFISILGAVLLIRSGKRKQL